MTDKNVSDSKIKSEVIAEISKEIGNVKVGQVRDSMDIDSKLMVSAFAVVTKIINRKSITIINYDLVTDHGIIREKSVGVHLFVELFPVIYLNHVNQSSAFGQSYKDL